MTVRNPTLLSALATATSDADPAGVARLVWADASRNFTFDFNGGPTTCDWRPDEACVEHPTYRGGSEEAYDACRNSTLAAFADGRLDAAAEARLLFNAGENIPMGDCTSLVGASREIYPDNPAVDAARAEWLKENPDYKENPDDGSGSSAAMVVGANFAAVAFALGMVFVQMM